MKLLATIVGALVIVSLVMLGIREVLRMAKGRGDAPTPPSDSPPSL